MHKVQKVIFGLTLGALPIGGIAKPFCPMPRDYEQPNGNIVTIKVYGDEHYSFATTLDGKLIVDSLATYYYADGTGNNSGIVAKNEEERTPAENALLQAIDQQEAQKKHQQRIGYKLAMPQEGNRLKSLNENNRPSIATITRGKKRVVTLLVQSPQKAFATSVSDWDAKLNAKGYNKDGHNGSVRDYFLAQSRGILDVTFDVYGPISLSQRIENMKDDDIMQEALNSIGSLPAGCDDDNDGYIDCIIVVTAGQNSTADNGQHGVYTYNNQYNSKDIRKDGKKAGRYIFTTEKSYYSAQAIDGSGSIIHEFGHILGLPDLYAPYGQPATTTPTYWDVMDVGCYNGWNKNYTVAGTCVPNYSMMELLSLGWAEPTEFTLDSIGQYTLPDIMQDKAYLFTTNQPNEYFLLENRQQVGWDKELPGHGLIVWHINYNAYTWTHQKINAEVANWVIDVAATNKFNANDLSYNSYPGSAKINKIEYLTDLKGTNYPINIDNITERNGYICFSTNGRAIDDCPCKQESTIAPELPTAEQPNVTQSAQNEWTISAHEMPISWVLTNVKGQIVENGNLKKGEQKTIRLNGAGIYLLNIGNKTVKLTSGH